MNEKIENVNVKLVARYSDRKSFAVGFYGLFSPDHQPSAEQKMSTIQ